MLLIDNSRYSREDDIEYLLKHTHGSCANRASIDVKSEDADLLNGKKNISELRTTKTIRNLGPLKGIIIFSLCLLIVFCIVIFIYFAYKSNLTQFYSKFGPQIDTLNIGAEMFLVVYLLVNILRLFTILRTGFVFKLNVDQQDEINETIAYGLSHWFYLANFLQLGAVLTSAVDGNPLISSIMNFISSIMYLKSYLNVKRRQNSSTTGGLTYIGYNISMSMYLGLSNLLFILNTMQVLNGQLSVSKENLEILSYIIHFILFTFVILTIVYLKDQYYAFSIILFMSGILISYNIKHESRINRHILIFSVLNVLTFIFSFCRYNVQKDRDSIEENYRIEKNNQQ